MKEVIVQTVLVSSKDQDFFEKRLNEEIEKMQREGFETNIQYSTTPIRDGYSYALFSALLIARQPQKEIKKDEKNCRI